MSRSTKKKRKRDASAAGSANGGESVEARNTSNVRTVFLLALAGAAMLFLAMPPVDWGLLGFLAPVPWLVVVRRREGLSRREYLAVWAGYVGFWLALLHWMPYAHPAIYVGWLAISLYLGAYLPLFVALARVGVHRCGISVIIVTPVVWTGLELARAHLLSGFTIGGLGHTLHQWPAMIQIADLGGAYAVSFVVMLTAASLARMLPGDEHRDRHRIHNAWPIAPVVVVLLATWTYGTDRLATVDAEAEGPPLLRAALIQGSIDIHVKADKGAKERIYQDHLRLSLDAVRQHDNLDVLIWPETMHRDSLLTFSDDARLPDGIRGDLQIARDNGRVTLLGLTDLQRAVGVPMLIGLDALHVGDGVIDHHNSAVLVDAAGEITAEYDKMHPVMFGEYIPFGDIFPWLYELTAGALPAGVQPGERLEAFQIGDTRMAVNICYETTVPHLLRWQISEMRAAGQEPDVLINLTNDGWFYGASELDIHLISGLFRAVELRKPLLIAANTGFSASIDAGGRVLAQGKRRAEDIVLGEPRRCQIDSLYTRLGDVPTGLCLAVCVVLAAIGWRSRWQQRRIAPTAAT